MPQAQACGSESWLTIGEELQQELHAEFTESAASNISVQINADRNTVNLPGTSSAAIDTPEEYEDESFVLLQNKAKEFEVARSIPQALYPRQSDGVAGLEVPAEISVMLKCLLRCLHNELPFHRLAKQTRVTKDMDRFATRYLTSLYRTCLRCGTIQGAFLDKTEMPLALETWLHQMLVDSCTRGFNLNGFSMTNAEICQVALSALCIFHYVSSS